MEESVVHHRNSTQPCQICYQDGHDRAEHAHCRHRNSSSGHHQPRRRTSRWPALRQDEPSRADAIWAGSPRPIRPCARASPPSATTLQRSMPAATPHEPCRSPARPPAPPQPLDLRRAPQLELHDAQPRLHGELPLGPLEVRAPAATALTARGSSGGGDRGWGLPAAANMGSPESPRAKRCGAFFQ